MHKVHEYHWIITGINRYNLNESFDKISARLFKVSIGDKLYNITCIYVLIPTFSLSIPVHLHSTYIHKHSYACHKVDTYTTHTHAFQIAYSSALWVRINRMKRLNKLGIDVYKRCKSKQANTTLHTHTRTHLPTIRIYALAPSIIVEQIFNSIYLKWANCLDIH